MPIPIFSILAAAGTAIANGVATHRANKVNQKNYEEVRRYNTPGAQMSRFRAANLNPNLIYTQTNEAEQRPEWKAPQFDFSALSNAPSELSSYQNINESKARVGNIEATNRKLELEIAYQAIVNKYADDIQRLTKDQIVEQINNIKAVNNKISQEVVNLIEGLKLQQQTFWRDTFQQGIDNIFKSKEIEIELSKLGLEYYKTQIQLQWQIKLNELISRLPDLGKLGSDAFEFVKSTWLETLVDTIRNFGKSNKSSAKSSSQRTYGVGTGNINF